MELVTVALSEDRILGLVPEISSLFKALGFRNLLVEFGWGAGVPQEDWWKPISVDTDELNAYVKASVAERSFRPGVGDLFINDEGKSVQFKLCHEADVHLFTENRAVLEQVARSWDEKGIAVHGRG